MTSQRVGCAALAAATALLAPTAPKAVEVAAGDWKLTFTGNVNVHYIHSSCDDSGSLAVNGGLACIGSAGEDDTSSVSNGLLPAALGISAATTQGGYDLGVTFGFFPGISTNDGGSPNLGASPTSNSNTALGTAGLDVRQVFLTFGNDSMGTFMFGRNIGLFGQDAILGDMTLIGVGVGNGNYAAPSNTSLGSIGLGYIYTDWLAQMNYTTRDLNGLKITVGIFDPVEPILQGTATPEGEPGFHGKVAYTMGDWYFSATFLAQKQEGPTDAQDFDSHAFDVGGKVKLGLIDLMAYYYSGKGVGTTGLFIRGDDGNGNERDSDGFIAQATYKMGDTKFGVNYGESNLDRASGEAVSSLVEKNSKVTVGVYHSLTKNLTLLAEFSDVEAEAHNGLKNDSSNINVGAFLEF
jgi:predicted porin